MNIKDILKEIQVDRTQDHLISLIHKEKLVIPFKIDNIQYEFVVVETILNNDEKIASVMFKNITAAKLIKKGDDETIDSYSNRVQNAKLGITGTGKNMRVFNKVFNILISYLEKYKPKYLHYFAIENNRKMLYDKILGRLQNKTNIKFTASNVSPDGSSIKENEFYYVIQYE